ncbi:MAG TPA: FAD-dependent oxidoreductase [Bryobacteraceae bacterium]|jgi:ribulose 1,5-bisphosphate synthetase/thiazole synthase|nr:FAD-dependent oxidoreductase [Bryobacteraceae bacterium]
MKLFKNFSRRRFLQTAGTAAVVSPALHAASGQSGNSETKQSFRLTREIPIESGYDVVVAGGGPSGAAAAISAARLGAKVLLLEAIGSMGGMGTNAFVSNWYSLNNGEAVVVGGFIVELIHALYRDKQVAPEAAADIESGRMLNAVGFNPEALKLLFDKLCHDSGVEVRYFTRVIDADVDHERCRIKGVITSNIEGYRYIGASTFIDCTGDAVLTQVCGAKVRAAGKDTKDIMPPTLCAMISDIDYTRFKKATQQAMVEKAVAEDFFTQSDRHVPGLFRSGLTTATMNAGHLFHMDALNCRSLSDGMMHGRQLAQEYAAFYRKYMAGCENMQVIATGSLMGVRESRRILGEYEMNYDDFRTRRKFPDQIALYCKAIDIHVYDLSPEEYQRYYEEFNKADRLKKGESYGIPYGVLVPKGWANLWAAGRCVSTDIKVNGAIRDQPACSMLGQAAGTAAVQSVKTGQPAYDLDTAQLVSTLRKAGANLPQETLSKQMTRAHV